MQCKKRSLLYRVVCGCLVNHSHTRQEGTTGLFQAKEIQNYGHPHQDGISLATIHLPQVTVFSHLPLDEVLNNAIFGILNSHCSWQFYPFFPPLYCHQPKFPCTILYNWLVFFHHITWASNGTNSVTLKMEAVWSSKMAEHLSPNSAETRRQSSSAQLPWKTCTNMSNYTYQTQTAFQQVLCFMLLFYDTNYWVQCHYACCQPTCLGDITLHQYGSHHITYSI